MFPDGSGFQKQPFRVCCAKCRSSDGSREDIEEVMLGVVGTYTLFDVLNAFGLHFPLSMYVSVRFAAVRSESAGRISVYGMG